MRILKRIFDFIFDTIQLFVLAASFFVVLYLFAAQPNEVKGISMEPNFHDKEYILTDKVSYRLRDPKRGDVVIFKSPKDPENDFIKRVIAVPGERVKVQDGQVYVNGKVLPEPYIHVKTEIFSYSFMKEGEEVIVPTGEYFVLGDNRNHSSDSREWGTVDKNKIIGRAFFCYYPPSCFGKTKPAQYPF